MGWNRKRAYKAVFWGMTLLLVLLVSVAYLRYRDLKKSLLVRLSEKVTSLIGPTVLIEDLSIGLPGTVNVYDISIKNPEGFRPGNFLRIKSVRLDTDLRQLIKGVFHFRKITFFSPELTLLRDEKGRWNIPDVFTGGSRKSTPQLQVDELRIESGLFDWNGNKTYRSDRVNLRVKNLSFEPGAKTEIDGTVLYGDNRIQVEGWVSLHDTSSKVNLSISSKDFALAPFARHLRPYGVDLGETRTDIDFHVEGDTDKGFHIVSTLRGRGVQFLRFIGSRRGLQIRTDAMLSPGDDSLAVNSMVLEVDGITRVALKGVMTGLTKKPSFRADINIDNLDLSQLNLMKDLKIRGILTSSSLQVAGDAGGMIRRASGSLKLREGGIETARAAIANIDAGIVFSSGPEISVKAEATARVVRAGEILLSKPVDTRLAATLTGRQRQMAILSSLALSSMEMRLKDGKTIGLEGGHVSIDGTIQGEAFSGKHSAELKGIQYDGHRLSRIKSASMIDYGQAGVAAKNLAVETEEVSASAGRLRMAFPEKGNRYEVDIKGMDATYRVAQTGESRLKECDLSLTLFHDKDSLRGDFTLSAGSLMIQEIASSRIAARGTFDEKVFSTDIQGAEVFGGSIKLTASGRTSKGPYPVKTNAVAEGLDLGAISKATARFIQIPCRVAGSMKRATFDGILQGGDSLRGRAVLEPGKISLLTGAGKNVIKDALLHGEVEFAGRDLSVKAEGAVGVLSMKVSGTAKRFLEQDRRIQAKITLPEVKLTEIRNGLWDVFPDGLLYVGLDGSITFDGSVDYRQNGLDLSGSLSVKDGGLQGENGEYSIRSINGTLPIAYRKPGKGGKEATMPSFERSQFEQWVKHFAQELKQQGLQKITIRSLAYGFDLLEDIQLFIEQKGPFLNVERFNANLFGGRLNGTAVIDLSDPLRYGAGFLVKGVSLKTLCDGIEPIKGFISGRVDGIGTLKGSGPALSGLIGMADFWTYPAKTEKMVISKEFLQKIGGPSVKTYLGSRNFDKGVVSFYLKEGDVIFKDLEISNRNVLGMTDLSVKVAPLSNRIALDSLLWTIAEASERAKKK